MINITVLSLEKMPPSARPVNGLARPMQALLGGPEHCRVEYIELAMPNDAIRLPNNTLIPWDHTLTRNELLAAPCTKGKITEELLEATDIVMTAHQTMGGTVGKGFQQASHKAKWLQVQGLNAEGAPEYDQRRPDVLIPQPHEDEAEFAGLSNVVNTEFAIHDFDLRRQAELRAQAEKIVPAMKHPVLAVMLGGNDKGGFVITPEDMTKLGREVALQAEHFAEVYVVSMGRTSAEQLTALKVEVRDSPNVFIDDTRFSYGQILSSAAPDGEEPDRIIASCEGSLLNSEARSTGKPVSMYVYRPEIYERLSLVKQGAWPKAIQEGKLAIYPEFTKPHAGSEEDTLGLSRRILNKIGFSPT